MDPENLSAPRDLNPAESAVSSEPAFTSSRASSLRDHPDSALRVGEVRICAFLDHWKVIGAADIEEKPSGRPQW